MRPHTAEQFAASFWRRVDRSGGCWPWRGFCHENLKLLAAVYGVDQSAVHLIAKGRNWKDSYEEHRAAFLAGGPSHATS